MQRVPEIAAFFRERDNFLLATHVNPESDAIGSTLALLECLRAMGKRALAYDRDGVPEFCGFHPLKEEIRTSLNGLDTASMTLVLLDCNSPERANIKDINFRQSIVIDHHVTKSAFGDVSWIVTKAPATGMLIYALVKEFGVKMTKSMAANLYAAIAVDTGTFRFNNTTAESLRAAADLVETGAEPGRIAEGLYENWSKGKFNLLFRIMGSLEVVGDIAITHVNALMFAETGTKPEDTENFANFPRGIMGINIAAFFRETAPGEWKASLRSKDGHDVSAIAHEFGGGGHINASGYSAKGDYDAVRDGFLKTAEGQRQEKR